MASSWCSSARPAAARRPPCAWSRASRTSADGVVRIGDRVVNDLSPKSRDIAMVFQSYALYPHMSVRDNIAFPLKIAKVPKDEIGRRVDEAARMLDLEPYLKRKPRALSGGQRQRVAMGRAIVREPAAFLMDEPLSNLDAKLRVQMRADIKKLQQTWGDDDLRHARSGRGDDDGRPRRGHAQGGAAAGGAASGAVRPSRQHLRRRLHRQPRDEHARGAARAGATGACSSSATTRLELDEQPWLAAYVGGAVVVGIRPEDLEDAAIASGDGGGRLRGRVEMREALGSEVLVHFTIAARQASPTTCASSRRTWATTGRRSVGQSGEAGATLVGRFSPRTRADEGEHRCVGRRACVAFLRPEYRVGHPQRVMSRIQGRELWFAVGAQEFRRDDVRAAGRARRDVRRALRRVPRGSTTLFGRGGEPTSCGG